MVALEGGLFLMSEVSLYLTLFGVVASEAWKASSSWEHSQSSQFTHLGSCPGCRERERERETERERERER